MVATNSESKQQAALAIGRAAVYTTLAQSLSYPKEQSLADLAGTIERWSGLIEAPGLAPLISAFRGSTRDELETGFISTFTIVTSPDCPTYESAWVCTDQGQQPYVMADVAGFYRAFGVARNDGGGFREDDVAVELEFMGFLCRKEAYAIENLGPERVHEAVKTQRLFLEQHLGRWAGAFGQKVSLLSAHEFYRSAGSALSDWIEEELEYLTVEPELLHIPTMPWQPPQSGGWGPESGGPMPNKDALGTEEVPVVR